MSSPVKVRALGLGVLMVAVAGMPMALLAQDPAIRAAIESGRHPFRLSSSAQATPAQSAAPGGQMHRIDKGVVTEAVIAKLDKGISRLVLGPGVSITPLARDKAKARNISVERIGQ